MLARTILATLLLTPMALTAAEARRDPRPTRAALIACQMGPHFLGEAWRGKHYRPFTRSGRPRICLDQHTSS